MKEEKGQLFGFPCDMCTNVICAECAGTAASEVRVLLLRSRSLFHFCPGCRGTIIKNVLEMTNKINKLEKEFEKVKENQKLDVICKKIKDIEGEVNRLKKPRNDECVLELRDKLNVIEKHIIDIPANNRDSMKILEATLIRSLSKTVDGHMDRVMTGLDRVTKCVSEGHSDVGRCPTRAAPDVCTSPKETNLDKGKNKNKNKIITPQNVAQAVVEAKTHEALNKYINLASEGSNTGQLFKPSQGQNAKPVRGTNKNSSIISAAMECKEFYVGNLSTESTVEKLKAYLLDNKIPVMSCNPIVNNGRVTAPTWLAYRISVSPHLENSILDSNLWPENVIVKPFTHHGAHQHNNGFRNFRRQPRARFTR